MSNWSSKLNEDLRTYLEAPRDTKTFAECLISINGDGAEEVRSLIVDVGGYVRHHVPVIPGFVATLPTNTIGLVASNEHVLFVESDVTYDVM